MLPFQKWKITFSGGMIFEMRKRERVPCDATKSTLFEKEKEISDIEFQLDWLKRNNKKPWHFCFFFIREYDKASGNKSGRGEGKWEDLKNKAILLEMRNREMCDSDRVWKFKKKEKNEKKLEKTSRIDWKVGIRRGRTAGSHRMASLEESLVCPGKINHVLRDFST